MSNDYKIDRVISDYYYRIDLVENNRLKSWVIFDAIKGNELKIPFKLMTKSQVLHLMREPQLFRDRAKLQAIKDIASDYVNMFNLDNFSYKSLYESAISFNSYMKG